MTAMTNESPEVLSRARSEAPQHAGAAIVQSLAAHGVSRVFSVPGESFLAVLDGLYDFGIQNVVTRHEGGAAYMAESHGKFTGRPGVAMVTRGPGAANAHVALHTAWQDGSPMVLFVGLIPTHDRQRDSFQEFDPRAWFGTEAKRVLVLDEAENASEIVAEAFFAASSGRPGPVVVGLPEDVITHPFTGSLHAPVPVSEGALSRTDVETISQALAGAERPLLFLGGQRWTPEATAAVTSFAEEHMIPVLHDWRASDRVPFSSPVNAGWLGFGRTDTAAHMLDEADALIAVGQVPTDVPTDGYTLRQRRDALNILVTIDTSLRGRTGAVSHHIIASPVAFAEALGEVTVPQPVPWKQWCSNGREAHRAASKVPELSIQPPTAQGTAHMAAVMGELVPQLPQDVVITFGAGNHCAWAQSFIPTETFPSQLSPRNGSMGYSIPSGVAASLEAPERLVVTICGDGEFLMNAQELATGAQEGAAQLVIVVDNSEYGTIRAHQEAHFPGRISGTQLSNPDFVTFARSFGSFGVLVEDDPQVPQAIAQALHAVRVERRAAVIHVKTDQALSFPTF